MTSPVLRAMSHRLRCRIHCGIITAPLLRHDYLYRNLMCGGGIADTSGGIILLCISGCDGKILLCWCYFALRRS